MEDNLHWIIIGVSLAVIFLVIFIVLSMWRKVSQDKAMVVTGLRKRVISGGGGMVIPILERTDVISLENKMIEVRTGGALTEQGVNISADGVAIIKVKSDTDSILAAVEQFNTGNENKTVAVINSTAKYVLEGKLREIISKLTVEEIYKDKEKFASQVQEVAGVDLAKMGLEIKAFTIRDINDDNGYLDALGKGRIAEVKRDAAIAEAEAERETMIKTADAHRLGEQAQLLAQTAIAESVRDKEIKVQEFRRTQEVARAAADLAYEIEANKVKKEVTETEMQVEIIRREKDTELAKQEALRKEQELEATIKKQADANKYKEEKDAQAQNFREVQIAQAKSEAIRLEGTAIADAKRMQGMAEVEIIREKGKAEAEAMMKKAEAFKQYNDAAVTQMIIEQLPQIAEQIAAPLSKTEKITIIDSGGGTGGGAAKVTGYVTDIIATLPAAVEAITGIDLVDKIKGSGALRAKKNDAKPVGADVPGRPQDEE